MQGARYEEELEQHPSGAPHLAQIRKRDADVEGNRRSLRGRLNGTRDRETPLTAQTDQGLAATVASVLSDVKKGNIFLHPAILAGMEAANPPLCQRSYGQEKL